MQKPKLKRKTKLSSVLIWLSEETDLSETKTTTDQGIQREQQFLVPGKPRIKAGVRRYKSQHISQ